MKLIITIDTEEDNWGDFSPTGHTLENIKYIPRLQELFDKYYVKPTYLITYPVVTDDRSISILKGIMDRGRCEIGSHCHPWNTPPFEEETGERNSMLCNLPPDLQYRKIEALTNAIIKNFGILPVSFRTGRWGYNQDVAENLSRLGYRVDTSITPYVDWTNYYGPDNSEFSPEIIKYACNGISKKMEDAYFLQVPATIGFLQPNFTVSNRILKAITGSFLARLRLVGILSKLGLFNRVWLSPEVSDSKNMIKLTQVMMKQGYKVVNMVFHSSSLKAGLSPFVKTLKDEQEFLKRIEEFLIFTSAADIKSIRLSDTLNLL